MSEQGSKAGRRERHQASERAKRERKKLRKLRGEIYRAIQQAEVTRKRRRKGQSEFDKIMVEQGYVEVSKTGTLDQRYERVS